MGCEVFRMRERRKSHCRPRKVFAKGQSVKGVLIGETWKDVGGLWVLLCNGRR